MSTRGASDKEAPGDLIGSAGPHVLVADVDAAELRAEDRHHLERVLRLRDGDPLTVGDGAGRWRRCRFGRVLAPVGETATVPRLAPALTVGFAVLKGGRSDLIVQKLTELGMDRIVAFRADRSVKRWDDESASRMLQRWQRIAREAVMQCRRAWLPLVDGPLEFEGMNLSQAALAVPGAAPPTSDDVFVLVGPEGGWSEAELSAVPRHVGLGPNILRSETAAFAAAALLAAARSGFNRAVAG